MNYLGWCSQSEGNLFYIGWLPEDITTDAAEEITGGLNRKHNDSNYANELLEWRLKNREQLSTKELEVNGKTIEVETPELPEIKALKASPAFLMSKTPITQIKDLVERDIARELRLLEYNELLSQEREEILRDEEVALILILSEV